MATRQKDCLYLRRQAHGVVPVFAGYDFIQTKRQSSPAHCEILKVATSKLAEGLTLSDRRPSVDAVPLAKRQNLP